MLLAIIIDTRIDQLCKTLINLNLIYFLSVSGMIG